VNWPFGKKERAENNERESQSAPPRAATAQDAGPPLEDEISASTSASPPLPSPSAPKEEWPAVFISYRRTNQLIVEHIHLKYCDVYKASSIFLDRTDLKPGAHFPDELRQAVTRASIVLVVIGRDWASMQNEQTYSKRLDEEGDWVRQEVLLALQGPGLVIPVLVDGAKLPTAEQLPTPLRPLIERNAVSLSVDHFGDDVSKLVAKLGEKLGEERVSQLRVGNAGPYAEAATIKPYALSDLELQAVLKDLPQWRVLESDITDDPRVPSGYRRVELVRDFLFESFADAISFMQKASGPIDAFGHHPRWGNVFRTVTVAYSTWDIGHRPSDRDQKSAHMLERLYSEFMTGKAAARS
jgi:pterin-4a-carbinolamine dehydratase